MGIFHQGFINVGIAMAEVRHISEALKAVHGLVAAGMKACPVARKPAALRRKLCPARFAINGIQFLPIAAGIVVENHVRIYLERVLVSSTYEIQQVLPGSKPGLSPAFLVELAEIEVVIGVISHGIPLGG